MKIRNSIVLLTLLLAACQNVPERPAGFIACTEPRPQVCTMIFKPVCAEVGQTGAVKTYPSACSACSDSEVVGYTERECGQ